MKVNEVVTEVTNAHLDTLSNRLSSMGLHDAITKGLQDTKLREVARNWLDKWNDRLQKFKQLPNQTTLTGMMQELVYSEMEVNPSSDSDKAIQELVDLTSTENSTSNIALKYMSKLMTLSLLKPSEERNTVEYGEYLPPEMMQVGKIVPVRYVLANDDTVWVKFNGDWYKDIDDSDHQVKLHTQPAMDSYNKLESMKGRNKPMRIGQQGTRTLEFLHRSETKEWFDEYE